MVVDRGLRRFCGGRRREIGSGDGFCVWCGARQSRRVADHSPRSLDGCVRCGAGCLIAALILPALPLLAALGIPFLAVLPVILFPVLFALLILLALRVLGVPAVMGVALESRSWLAGYGS